MIAEALQMIWAVLIELCISRQRCLTAKGNKKKKKNKAESWVPKTWLEVLNIYIYVVDTLPKDIYRHSKYSQYNLNCMFITPLANQIIIAKYGNVI